ncbi:MAG: hypothetical protein K8R73_05225 [Clostridiales bacterium]|nr:hypothetical protein [Clostridiales bacterium]
MNIDIKTHKFLTLIMYINYVCSYVVVFMFNDNPVLPCLFLTVNLIISSVSHYKYYKSEGVNAKAKIVLIIQMIVVFCLTYFDRSTFELLFVLLIIGDCIFAFSYKYSMAFTSITFMVYFPFMIYIYKGTMGYSYDMTRDIVVLIFVLTTLYISKMQIIERVKYNKVLTERNIAFAELGTYAIKIKELAIHEERSRIAYMLHNSIGHMLVSINLSLQAEKMELIKSNVLTDDHFSNVEDQISTTMALLRKTIENSDDFMTTLELEELLEMFVSNIKNNTSISIQYALSISNQIPRKLNTIIYNVILESVTNSLKHAHCKNIMIRIEADSNILISIEDDGEGFDTIVYGFGITQIKEKLKSYGGEYSITAHNNCEVRIVLPFPIP